MRSNHLWCGAVLVALLITASKPIPVLADDQAKPKTGTVQIHRIQADDAAEQIHNFLNSASQIVAIYVDSEANKLELRIPPENYDEVMKLVTEFVATIDLPPAEVIKSVSEFPATIDVPPEMPQLDILILEVRSQDGKETLRVFGDGENVSSMAHEHFEALIADLQEHCRIDAPVAEWIRMPVDNPRCEIFAEDGFRSPPRAFWNMSNSCHEVIRVQVTPNASSDHEVLVHINPQMVLYRPRNNDVPRPTEARGFYVGIPEMTKLLVEGETTAIGFFNLYAAARPGLCLIDSQIPELIMFITPHLVKQ
jgi:hypothetical protein